MRRAFPEKVNLVPSCVTDNDADAVAVALSQTIPGANRRVRSSAAMIGLAISMGAYSLLAPQQGDQAVAADPIAVDPTNVEPVTVPTVPTADVAVLSPESGIEVVSPSASSRELRSNTIGHTVQVGQTLWRIAQLYKIDVSELAAANALKSDSVLLVGQILSVPSRAVDPLPSVAQSGIPAPERTAVISSSQPGVFLPSADAQQALKAEQEVVVAKLRDTQSRLKVSLAELKSEEVSRGSLVSAEAGVKSEGAKSENRGIGLISYQVSAGDTLSSIAKSHGVSYVELAKINRLSDPNLLEADQVIKVPQAATSTVVPTSIQSQLGVAVGQGGEAAPSNMPVVSSLSAIKPIAAATAQNLALVPATQRFNQEDRQDTVSPVTQPSQATSGQSRSGRYVESLMGEVVKLRQKYSLKADENVRPALFSRAKAKVAPTLTVSALPTVSRQVNSEFKARSLQVLQGELRNLQQNSNSSTKAQPIGVSLPSQAKPQLVARGSIGSESYAPIVNSAVGKMVSPALPPLGKADAYLPSGSAKFKGYIWPAQGVFTSGYGWRWGRMHKGIDIAAPVGTPIVAAAPGVVLSAGWNDGGYGNLVEIQHPDGSVTLYGHNDRVLVRPGQQVDQGQQIAAMGSTGYSTGPHSHFEVHLPGQGAVNPVAYLPDSRS